jgi:hypothetical protein
MFEKNKDYPFLRFKCFEHAKLFLIVSIFEDLNFAINERYSKKIMEIQIIMLPL